jgi:hypothetical protein
MFIADLHRLNPQPRLVDAIGQTLILAYRESTGQLENALSATGLSCEVVRQIDQPDYQNYASIHRCMLNHQQAWIKAAHSTQPTLIVEADFVPVIDIGQLPLPFKPEQPDVGIIWLYTCAPQVYSISREGFAEGFSTSLVAYIVTPKAAALLCEFVTEVTQMHGTGYYNFDSEIDGFLRRNHLKNYISFRNYGEHGGKPNPEHRRNGMSGIHRADALYGKLAFLPAYAEATPQPQLELLRARLYARGKGVMRLLLGKFLRPKVLKNSSTPLRLLNFTVRRHLYW